MFDLPWLDHLQLQLGKKYVKIKINDKWVQIS